MRTNPAQRLARLLTGATVVGLLSIAGPAAADIYAAVDADGTPHFTNVPDSSRYRLVLRHPDNYRLKADQRYRRFDADAAPVLQAFAPSGPYADLISREAESNRLDPYLLDAVIAVESGHNPGARSPKGAIGLMQVMPDTARRYGIANVDHPENNVRAGARYLRDLLQLFDGDLALALAAYNAGEKAVMRHGNRIPPYAETRDYVPRVLKKYEELRVNMPARPASALPRRLAYRPS